MKHVAFLCALLLLTGAYPCRSQQPAATRADRILATLRQAASDQVLVVSHRGDWRNAPENSLEAIANCIALGVDIVEIDIRKTRDGQLVLMHDATLDRTTTGKGKVSEKTLAELQQLYLRHGHGHPSRQRIPTLEEALLLIKDKMLVNLDKCYEYFPEAYEILKRTGTRHQAILKAEYPAGKVQQDLGAKLHDIIFMPIVNLDKPGAWATIEAYQQTLRPLAFELVFQTDTARVLNRAADIQRRGARVWMNTLWPELNAGHDDDRAVTDVNGSYGWMIDHGATVIQTDRPAYMLRYLEQKKLHERIITKRNIYE